LPSSADTIDEATMSEPVSPTRTGTTGLASIAQWLVHAAAVFAGTFEAISVHATLSGLRPTGDYLSLAAFLALGVGVTMLTSSGAARRRLLAKGAIVTSVVAVAATLVIRSRIAEVQGALPPGVPVGQTALFFLFQLGWATTYWLTVSRGATTDARYIPSAIGTVLLIGGGFLLGQRSESAPETVPESASAVFAQSPSDEELAFATQTATAGDGTGARFAHYHAGNQPLLGLSFSTREWFRRERIAGDLRAVFDREAVPEAAHLLLAPEGFIIAGIEVQADDNVSALRVQFAPFEGGFVSPFDRYWSEWYGGYERADRGIQLDGASKPIVGVRGTSGLVLTSVSLLVAR